MYIPTIFKFACTTLFLSFCTSTTLAEIKVTVAEDGSGNYKTLQAAFDAVPNNNKTPYTISVKKGTYKQKVKLNESKNFVTLIGEDKTNTIITFDDHNKTTSDPSHETYTIAIFADDFTAKNITFQNTKTAKEDNQAVGLRVDGDRAVFINCNIVGGQDIYCAWGEGRIYNKKCYIEGTSDFIYGQSIAVFDSCTIHCKKKVARITAAKTPEKYKYGFVFFDCNIEGDEGINSYLGRPYGPYARTVYFKCREESVVHDSGWSIWNNNNNHKTCYYAEYKCTGPGYKPASRVNWSHQLKDSEASNYTLANIFAKSAANPAFSNDWIPQPNQVSVTNENFYLNTIVNPFVNTVYSKTGITLKYNLSTSKPMFVSVKLFDLNGKEITNLLNEIQSAGEHSLTLRKNCMPSGMYLATVEYGNSRLNTIFRVM